MTCHEDGSITVDNWYRKQWFSGSILRDSYPFILQYDPETETIVIHVANGRAVYRIYEWDHVADIAKALLVEAEIDIPHPLSSSS